jgi:membrane-bound lytic murein transglycosylase D
VRPGDNLTKVAQDNNLSLAQLRDWNQLPATGSVQAGQRLRLSAPLASAAVPADHVAVRTTRPAPVLRTTTHVVQPRDTLYSISRQFRVSVEELKRLNHLKSDAVKSGQKLVVPAG